MAYSGINRVDGSRSAIALTQQSSVHYYQRPDHEEHYDSTRTSLGGYMIAGGVKQVGGRVRYENNVRYATSGLELNDLGFVTLVNDASFKQSVDLWQTAPNRLFRSSFSTGSFETHWTTGGLLAAQVLSLHTSASLRNNWGGAITGSVSEIGAPYCVSCARGGPALKQSLKQGLRFDVVGDPRPQLVPRAAYRFGVSDQGRSWYRGGDAGVDLRVASRFSTSLSASYDHVVNDQQWVGELWRDTERHDALHVRSSRSGHSICHGSCQLDGDADAVVPVLWTALRICRCVLQVATARVRARRVVRRSIPAVRKWNVARRIQRQAIQHERRAAVGVSSGQRAIRRLAAGSHPGRSQSRDL